VVGLVIIGAAAIYTASRSDGGKRGGRLGRQKQPAPATATAAAAAPEGVDPPQDAP
jgi:hypothetical protein